MAEYYKATVGESTYPSSVYSKYGAPTIEDFCAILVQEANAEGVSANVVFAQAMLETGNLRFGGDVKAEQCNFCGHGATGNGNPGSDFSGYGKDAVRMGLRVQVQHLKAYASTDGLRQTKVDDRYDYVRPHGKAPYVEDLGNGNWATSTKYSEGLLSILSRL